MYVLLQGSTIQGMIVDEKSWDQIEPLWVKVNGIRYIISNSFTISGNLGLQKTNYILSWKKIWLLKRS